MHDFPSQDQIADLIRMARHEDVGPGDVTSRLLVPAGAVGQGTLVQREPGVVCGLPIVAMICEAYDPTLSVRELAGQSLAALEGRYSDARSTPLLGIGGPLAALLAAERVILNFLQHMSGVATLTRRYVRRVEGTGARIYDTRKTLPGFRVLDKYAVRCGGGGNHRMGLYDGLLVKDNHLASVSLSGWTDYLTKAVRASRAEDAGRFIEVEVDTLDQFAQVLGVEGIDLILLDNMDCPSMARAVQMRDASGKKGAVALEASGGITLETIRTVALSGVDRIAVGALTHSAPALDVGLDLEPAP